MPAEATEFAARGDRLPGRRPPPPFRSAGWSIPTESCGRSSGSTWRSAPHEVIGLVGPSGCGKSTLLELICGPARADRRARSRSEAPATPRGRLAHCAYMPQRDLLLPWFSAIDNAALALRNRGLGRAEARRQAGALFERFGLAGFEGTPPAELSGGHAPAGRLPAHARRRQAGAGARRAVRLARRDHPGRDAAVAGGGAATPTRAPSSSSPTTSRRRSTSPTGCRCSQDPCRREWSRSCGRQRPRARTATPRSPTRSSSPRASGRCGRCEEGCDDGRACWLLPALLLAVLIGAWQVAATHRRDRRRAATSKASSSPRPPKSPHRSGRTAALLAENAWVTLKEVLLGFGCALVAGLFFAVVLHFFETMRRAFYPLIVASQTIPIIVIAPILVVWFGFGIGPKLAIIALICFFPITVNALDGLRSVDPDATKMMRTLDASRWQTFRRVEAPTALPYVFSGAKIAVAVALIGAVFAEWAGPESGLGRLMLHDNDQSGNGAGFSPPSSSSRQWRSRSSACWPSLSGASSLGDRTQGMKLPPNPGDRGRHRARRPRARPGRLRGEERGRHRPGPALRPDARLLSQPGPRRDLHGAEARLLQEAGLDVSINSPSDPSAPIKEVAAGSHRPGDLLRARGGAGPATGPRRGRGRGAGRPAAHLDDLAEEVGHQGGRQPARQDDRHRRHPLPGRLPEDDPRPRQPLPLRRQGRQRRLRPAAGAGRRQRPGDARRLQQRRGRRPARARQGPGRHPGRQARRPHLRRAGPGRPAQAPRRRPGSDPPLHRRPRPRHQSPRSRARTRRPKPCSKPTTASTRS